MNGAPTASGLSGPQKTPGVWKAVAWAYRRGREGGGVSRRRLVARAVLANISQGSALRRWMAVVSEMHARGLVDDLEGEYLRALRPYVHRHTGVGERIRQMIDHVDWLDGAFRPDPLQRLIEGKPLVLAELRAPRGFKHLRLELRRSGVQSPEGELLLSLSAQRHADVQHKSRPVELAALAFSRFRIDGTACLVIGGVRGQRNNSARLSPVEISQALQGWKASVLLVSVMQELARAWGQQLVGLDPSAHRLQGLTYRWQRRHRDNAGKIDESYAALWNHFDAQPGPLGWMKLPLDSDEKLAATALSPEKRERQTRRADFWIRLRKDLRMRLRDMLVRQDLEARLSRVTQQATDQAPLGSDSSALPLMRDDDDDDAARFQARVMRTGSMNLP